MGWAYRAHLPNLFLSQPTQSQILRARKPKGVFQAHNQSIFGQFPAKFGQNNNSSIFNLLIYGAKCKFKLLLFPSFFLKVIFQLCLCVSVHRCEQVCVGVHKNANVFLSLVIVHDIGFFYFGQNRNTLK